MELINELRKEIMKNKMDKKWSLMAKVTHINNPHSFYVRPLVYEKFLPILETSDVKLTTSDIKLQGLVIFRSNIEKRNIRGIVSKIYKESKTYDITAIDFGFIEKSVPLRSLWVPFYTVELSSLISHCKLANCEPRGTATWSEDAIQAMKQFVDNEVVKMIIVNNASSILAVELYNSCPDDIATMLAYNNSSTLGYEASVINMFGNMRIEDTKEVKPAYIERNFKVNTVLHVRMQLGSILEYFYAVQVDEYKSYLNDRSELTYQCKANKAIVKNDLKLNAGVAVYDMTFNRYERGLVKEIITGTDSFRVILVDCGKIVEVNSSRLKPIPDYYLNTPKRAIWCTLDKDLTSRVKFSQYDLIGSEFLMTIKVPGSDGTPNVVLINPVS